MELGLGVGVRVGVRVGVGAGAWAGVLVRVRARPPTALVAPGAAHAARYSALMAAWCAPDQGEG